MPAGCCRVEGGSPGRGSGMISSQIATGPGKPEACFRFFWIIDYLMIGRRCKDRPAISCSGSAFLLNIREGRIPLPILLPKGRTVKIQLVMAAVAALHLGSTSTLRAQDKFKETPYYPVKVGDTWTYRIGDAPQKIQIKISKHEKVGDTTFAVMEVTVNGQLLGNETVCPQADGVYRIKGQILPQQTMELMPPMRFLKLPTQKGDTWKIDSSSARIKSRAIARPMRARLPSR